MKNAIIAMLLFFLFSANAVAGLKEWKVQEDRVDLKSDCNIYKSTIIGRLKDDCGGGKSEFTATDKAIQESNKGHRLYVIDSWEDFIKFRDGYFKSPFFMTKISKDFFKDNKLGVIFVIYTGLEFLKNEKLYKEKGHCRFVYETWNQEAEYPRACIWEMLYILKLRK